MSIAAMVDNEVAKADRKPPITRVRARSRSRGADESATRTSDVLSSLASYVPAEAIAAYLVLLPFMDPSGDGYGGRWWLALGITVLAVGYTVGYRKLAAAQADHEFSMPWLPIVTTVLAFAAWVFAIPTSPFNDFGFYTPELGGATGTIIATGISFVAAVTGETLTAARAEKEPKPDPAG